MKFVIAAASAAAIAAVAVPAFAQAPGGDLVGLYGSAGYAHSDVGSANLGAIQGRLGYRAHTYLGVEGELGYGVGSDKVDVLGANVKVKQRLEAGAYGVGYLPVSPNFDVVGRVGYGTTKYRASVPGVATASNSQESWNYGVGGQYRFDEANGLRAEYTRKDFTGSGEGHADVWSVGYVRRF